MERFREVPGGAVRRDGAAPPRPGKVFKRDEILARVWGDEVVVGGRTIDVHIRKLREKIGENNFKTVKGVGYKFVIEDE